MIAMLFVAALGYGLFSWRLEHPLGNRCRSTSSFVKNPPDFIKTFERKLAQISENSAIEILGWDLFPPVDFNCISVFPLLRTTVIGEFTHHGGSKIWFFKPGTKQLDGRFLGDPYFTVFVLKDARDVKIDQFRSQYNAGAKPNTPFKHWSQFEMDFEGWISKPLPAKSGFSQGQLVFIRHIHSIRPFNSTTGCKPVGDCFNLAQQFEPRHYWSP